MITHSRFDLRVARWREEERENMPESRRKRPPVQRTEPDRSVGARRRKTKSETANGSKADGEVRENGKKVDAREAGYRTINDAYRLIDEYVRQGQRMAENMWLPLNGPEADDKGQFKAPDRFMRAMSDMTLAWVELMQQWTTNVQSTPSQAATGEASPFTAGRVTRERGEPPVAASPDAGSASRALRVAVECRGRVEVSVHLADATTLASLVPSELRPFGAKAPPITGVSLDVASSADAPVLRIRVPDDQPAGAYNGLLVERGSERPRGTVSLLVH
jgi:hypothetical protein